MGLAHRERLASPFYSKGLSSSGHHWEAIGNLLAQGNHGAWPAPGLWGTGQEHRWKPICLTFKQSKWISQGSKLSNKMFYFPTSINTPSKGPGKPSSTLEFLGSSEPHPRARGHGAVGRWGGGAVGVAVCAVGAPGWLADSAQRCSI